MITQNEVKFVKSLAQRKFRQKYNKFIAEGDKICFDLLRTQTYEIVQIYAVNDWLLKVSSELQSFNGKVTEVSAKELSRISQLSTANQVAMVLTPTQHRLNGSITGPIIYLDDVQDPGNVGTIIRIADWFGVNHVVRSASTADFFSPKVVQSTMASLANVNLYSEALSDIKSILSKHQVVGALLGGQSLLDYKWKSDTIIVMGNESKGISPQSQALLDASLMIQGSKGRIADSLNVGIATALMVENYFRK